MTLDPGVIRAVGLFAPLVLTMALWPVCEPGPRLRAGALLATLWNLPALLLVHLVAIRLGWWRFGAQGGLFLAMPLDLWLGWAVWWGCFAALAMELIRARVSEWLALTLLPACFLLLDMLYMPWMRPVLQLGPHWLFGELLLFAVCFIPAQLLALWTSRDSRLAPRVILQIVCFTGLTLGVAPAAILQQTGAPWSLRSPAVILNLLSFPAIVGLSAVQEFLRKGRGTPFPFDPPKRLVTTGVYAYVRNPMQLAMTLIFAVWGIGLHSGWVALTSLIGVFYSAGIAAGDEQQDLNQRFGSAWADYRINVPNWTPRWRPWRPHPARLYIAAPCSICSEVQRWLECQRPCGLQIVRAELHPVRDLDRITYDSLDGGPEESGVAALGRALEHVHLGWAFLGWTIRLPLLNYVAQMIADAAGAGPVKVPRCDSGRISSENG